MSMIELWGWIYLQKGTSIPSCQWTSITWLSKLTERIFKKRGVWRQRTSLAWIFGSHICWQFRHYPCVLMLAYVISKQMDTTSHRDPLIRKAKATKIFLHPIIQLRSTLPATHSDQPPFGGSGAASEKWLLKPGKSTSCCQSVSSLAWRAWHNSGGHGPPESHRLLFLPL